MGEPGVQVGQGTMRGQYQGQYRNGIYRVDSERRITVHWPASASLEIEKP
jgi:hypothetical protein